MTDPRQEREVELIAETMMRSMDGDLEGAEGARQELENLQEDILPDPGKYRIVIPGPATPIPPVTATCSKCHTTFTTSGKGISFEPLDDRDLEADAIAMHIMYRCPSLEGRWYRLKWSIKVGGDHYNPEHIWTPWVRYFSTPRKFRRHGGPPWGQISRRGRTVDEDLP